MNEEKKIEKLINPISVTVFFLLLGLDGLFFFFGYINWFAAVVWGIVALLIAQSIQIADQWEKAVVLRMGRYRGLRGPGLFFVIPILDRVSYHIDQRIRTTDFGAESCLTKDTVPVNVDAIAFWVVYDAERAALEVQQYQQAVVLAAQTALRDAKVLLVGAGSVTLFGLARLGGWGAMVEAAEPGFFNIWKSMSHPDFPWTGMAFGAPIIAIWYWCTDQFIVQRTLSARGIDHARRGTIAAGYLKQLPLFVFVVPGVIALTRMRRDAARHREDTRPNTTNHNG